MTLSSSETEWAALLEATKEVMIIVKLLRSMNISVKLPLMVRVDNLRAIVMIGDVTATSHTKHVLSYKNLNEYIEDGIYIPTKKLSGDLHERH